MQLHSFWNSAYRAKFLQDASQVALDTDRTHVASNLDGDPNKRIVKHDYESICDRVKEIATAVDIRPIGSDANFETWANETHRIADEIAYGKLTFHASDEFHLHASLTADYVSSARDIAKRQLKLAGIRLALVLNEIWK